MDTYSDIIADTKRYKAEAIKLLADFEAGRKKPINMSFEQAIWVLNGNIQHYDSVLRHLGEEDA